MSAPISAAWKHRDLRVLVIGEGVSVFGSMVSRLALPWTAARELGQGTLSVGLVFTAELLPVALLGLFAGALVDRWSRRRLLSEPPGGWSMRSAGRRAGRSMPSRNRSLCHRVGGALPDW